MLTPTKLGSLVALDTCDNYRPHSKDGEGYIFTLCVSPHLDGGGTQSQVQVGVPGQGGGGPRSGWGVPGPGRGGPRSGWGVPGPVPGGGGGGPRSRGVPGPGPGVGVPSLSKGKNF